MAKKAPFFSHDMNARHDPKMSAMRGVYGSQGYGWFWMLIEMMAESDGYRLDCKSKYTFNAYAMQLQCKAEEMQKFITDCIVEFELFESDSMYFWSKSLRNRMQYRDLVSEKRAEAANKRWEKKQGNANASESDAIGMQIDTNETKLNKTKDSLLLLINKNEIMYENEDKLELILSFVNVMDVEVIEDVINRSKGNHMNYVMKALRNRMKEGNTKKDSIKPGFKSQSEKEAELQQRLAQERKNAEAMTFKPEFEDVSA